MYRIAILCLILLGSFANAADRPNIVWLLSEDNSKHYLKLFDEHGSPTPRIEALAKDGLVFEHAFSNSPVCSVARTTLMTACYGPRIGTHFHRKSKLVPMPDGLEMFPAYLAKAGYHTTNNQKKDYNAKEGKGVWHASSRRASWRARKKGQPFFHMQSFGASHESSLHFNAATMKNQKTTTDPKSVFLSPRHPDTPTFRYTYARYHDRIREIERQIGQVIDKLEQDGVLEDTFVFYFGDHGGVLPGSKGYLHEVGLHVPLVVRVPQKWQHLVGAKRGTRMKGFVSFVDFGPTVLNLAGVDVPDQVDGKPFLGKGVSADEVNERDTAYGYADRFDEKYDQVRTIRKGKYKYVRNYQPFNVGALQNNYRYRMLAYREWREMFRAGKLNASQRLFFEPRPAESLYDVESDPYETKDLAKEASHSKTVDDLRRRLDSWVKGMPDLSFYPESELRKSAFDNPVAFGQKHKAEIGELIDVANLSRVPFASAKKGIEAALGSSNPWKRYWALIVCSSHGKSANEFVARAKELASNDPELLVRVRAAEFLGLIGAADPRPTINAALAKTTDGIEATLILNTVVLLQDTKPGYKFGITEASLTREARQEPLVKRRLEYLTGK